MRSPRYYCSARRNSRSGSNRRRSRSPIKRRNSRSSSTRRHEFEAWTRKYEEIGATTSKTAEKEMVSKRRKRIGLISQDCPGFQGSPTRLWSTIDHKELTRILIDIRREVQQPRPRARVERELGDPSLFVVPRDKRQPLAGRQEFKGASKSWQEVTVLVSPLEGWEERLLGRQNKAQLESERLMSSRPEFRGAEKGWQKMVVVAKPIKEWEEKLEESLRKKVEMVVVVKPIKEWDDKIFPAVKERGSRWRKDNFKKFKTVGPGGERTTDKKKRRRNRG